VFLREGFCDPVNPIGTHQEQEKRVGVRERMRVAEMVRERRPPREFEHVIEHVFPFAELRRLDFNAGLFAIDAVEHANNQRKHNAGGEMAAPEENRYDGRNGGGEKRDLHRCDRRPAKPRHEPRFDRTVNDRRKIPRAVLCGIEKKSFRASMRPRVFGSGKPDWPQITPQRGDITRFSLDID